MQSDFFIEFNLFQWHHLPYPPFFIIFIMDPYFCLKEWVYYSRFVHYQFIIKIRICCQNVLSGNIPSYYCHFLSKCRSVLGPGTELICHENISIIPYFIFQPGRFLVLSAYSKLVLNAIRHGSKNKNCPTCLSLSVSTARVRGSLARFCWQFVERRSYNSIKCHAHHCCHHTIQARAEREIPGM